MNQDNFTSQADQQKISNQFLIIESQRDFIEFLFEHYIDWATLTEAQEDFERYELEGSKKNFKPKYI